jgi:hypothetical protein
MRRAMAPKSRTEKIDKLNQLRHLAGRTGPTPRETAEAWEIIRALDIEDVKACLAEIPQTPYRHVNSMMTEMLFHRWGQLDPIAAAEVAIKPPYSESNYSSPILAVATAWAERDAESALRWVVTLDPNSMAQGPVRNIAGHALAIQDPEHAIQKALTEFPHALSGVIGTLGMRRDTSDEARRKELQALPERVHVQKYLNQLRWAFANEGPERVASLIAVVEGAGISPEDLQRFKKDLEDSATRADRRQAMEKMIAPGSTASGHDKQRAFSSWSANEPEAALAWIREKGDIGMLAETVKQSSDSLLRSNWQPASSPTSNPWEKGIVSHFNVWREMDAASADAWLQSAPSDIRQHLTQDHATD